MNGQEKDFERIFIVGCGDIGRRVARLWQQRGLPVSGLVRSHASAQRLARQGIRPQQQDLDHPPRLSSPTPRLALNRTLVYYFAPPPKTGEQDPRVGHFLESIDTTALPAALIYLSTSGVYGDQGGRLIDEDTPARPVAPRARRRYHAEQSLRRWGEERGVPVITLRTGGIYGPGRLPLRRIRERVPVLHEHLAPSTNRIHADDLARACLAAAERGQAGRIYNISDGSHGNMSEYFNTIADCFGLPRPPAIGLKEAEQQLSAGMLSYLRESRRLDNRRMREELGVVLRYPDLRQGLAACIEEQEITPAP